MSRGMRKSNVRQREKMQRGVDITGIYSMYNIYIMCNIYILYNIYFMKMFPHSTVLYTVNVYSENRTANIPITLAGSAIRGEANLASCVFLVLLAFSLSLESSAWVMACWGY